MDDIHHDKFYNIIAGLCSNVDFEIVESKVNQQYGSIGLKIWSNKTGGKLVYYTNE